MDALRIIDQLESGSEVLAHTGPLHSSIPTREWLLAAEENRSAAVTALSKGNIGERAQWKGLRRLPRNSRNDDCASIGQTIDGACADARIDEEPPKDEIQTKEYEWNSPDREKKRSARLDHAQLPINRETTPHQAERNHERV